MPEPPAPPLPRPAEGAGFTSIYLRRGAAFVLDHFFVTAAALLILAPGVWLGRSTTGKTPTDPVDLIVAVLLPAYLLWFAVHLGYFVLLHAFLGRTLGKMILGVRVVDVRGGTPRVPEGAPPRLGQSFLRWSAYFVSALPFALGFLAPLVDREGAAWHDRIAETRVVREEPPSGEPPPAPPPPPIAEPPRPTSA